MSARRPIEVRFAAHYAAVREPTPLPGFPRPLTPVERSILDFLLSLDDPRLRRLRDQVNQVSAADGWGCCASIDLAIDGRPAPPVGRHGSLVGFPLVRTSSIERKAAPVDLLLWVRDGSLTAIELVHYLDGPGPALFPPPVAFNPPVVAR